MTEGEQDIISEGIFIRAVIQLNQESTFNFDYMFSATVPKFSATAIAKKRDSVPNILTVINPEAYLSAFQSRVTVLVKFLFHLDEIYLQSGPVP